MNEVITKEQFTKMIDFLMNDKRVGSFRYIIYDVMGFKQEDYFWLYKTGLMNFKDKIYDLRNKKQTLIKG